MLGSRIKFQAARIFPAHTLFYSQPNLNWTLKYEGVPQKRASGIFERHAAFALKHAKRSIWTLVTNGQSLFQPFYVFSGFFSLCIVMSGRWAGACSSGLVQLLPPVVLLWVFATNFSVGEQSSRPTTNHKKKPNHCIPCPQSSTSVTYFPDGTDGYRTTQKSAEFSCASTALIYSLKIRPHSHSLGSSKKGKVVMKIRARVQWSAVE